MTIAIIGASGFIGSALTAYLLKTTEHSLVLFSHRASRLVFTAEHERRIKHVDGSIMHPQDIVNALRDCDKAVYLVHLMGHGKNFKKSEAVAAHNFGKAAANNGIERVVYVGGMGDPETQAGHLQSRHATGDIIRKYVPSLIELKTPMVVGAGGAGYEVIKSIVEHSPIFPMPRWAKAMTNPITVDDVARYAAAALALSTAKHHSIFIGGPERLSYAEVAQRVAKHSHKQIRVVPIPFAPQTLAAWALRRFKNNAFAVTVADMIGSAQHSTKADSEALQIFPTIKPEPIETAF